MTMLIPRRATAIQQPTAPTVDLTDKVFTLWAARRHQIVRAAALRAERKQICGCTVCKDDDRGKELDMLILQADARVAELGEQITDHAPRI